MNQLKNPPINVLAINPGHNGSVALVSDGKLIFHIEEERLSRIKYDSNPFLGMKYAFENYNVDVLVIGGTHPTNHTMEWSGVNAYECFAKKYNKNVQIVYLHDKHHLGHAAAAFYNSGFDKALSIVVDGSGSIIKIKKENGPEIDVFETETSYKFEYPANYQKIYASFGTNHSILDYFENKNGTETILSDYATIVKTYEAVTNYLGFHFIEAGKTMGLSSYGKYDEKFSNLFIDKLYSHRKRANKNIIKNAYPMGAFVDSSVLQIEEPSSEWHKDSKLVTEDQKNLSWAIQNQSQKIVGDLIEHLVKMTGEKNIVISGGFGLNCVANYYYKKRFPNLNFYIEPVSSDAGTSIGLAKLVWSEITQQKVKEPLENLYLGLPNSNLVDADLIPSNYRVLDVQPEDVAKLISERNIVCIFQGRSEAGPRALGNRSILYDPRDPNGKDFVNIVKRREWFRPFAGSVMEEHASEYFDMAGLSSSPFMMYAVDVLKDKLNVIPAITHVDNTCRIQTVSEKDNYHYYNLIKAFKKITGVPILFNTSFNLAGDPLVETFEDALNTLNNSQMNYLYLPEYGKLLEKQNG